MKSLYSDDINNQKIKNSFFSKINVISVCRLVKQKNVYEILNIASILPEINFKVIGDGPLFKEIFNFLEKKKIKNLTLLGYKSNLFDYLYKSSIFLSTSLYEGLPNTILEAMSVGLPIVATNVVGNIDTFEHNKSGYFYTLGDIKSAAKFIRKLANNNELRENFGNASFKRQREVFSLNKMKDSYEKFYFDINNNFKFSA